MKGFIINRPFDHSLFAHDLTPIYKLCHSIKSINRPLISHERGPKQEEVKKKMRRRGEEKNRREETPPRPSLEFRSNSK
ncbi:hypothetical protein MA16_Dca020433 [Dendrobium catenatum]|uniref:Uncharacterized protein n=1 Tax=Dendrobium catenatum TaxID=906689 RepID=A0A2I0VB76_9ASPA|nr:hypothetical protein MA16_Dca020433 [Dendrobium catenatum]